MSELSTPARDAGGEPRADDALRARLDGASPAQVRTQLALGHGEYGRLVLGRLARVADGVQAARPAAAQPHRRAELLSWLAGLASAGPAAELERHVAGCLACASFVDDVRVRASEEVGADPRPALAMAGPPIALAEPTTAAAPEPPTAAAPAVEQAPPAPAARPDGAPRAAVPASLERPARRSPPPRLALAGAGAALVLVALLIAFVAWPSGDDPSVATLSSRLRPGPAAAALAGRLGAQAAMARLADGGREGDAQATLVQRAIARDERAVAHRRAAARRLAASRRREAAATAARAPAVPQAATPRPATAAPASRPARRPAAAPRPQRKLSQSSAGSFGG